MAHTTTIGVSLALSAFALPAWAGCPASSSDLDGNCVNDAAQTVAVDASGSNDAAVIQAAIDSTPAGEFRIIQLAAGTYNLSTGLRVLDQRVLLRGAGIGQTILNGLPLPSGSSILRYGSEVELAGPGQPGYCGIEGITFTEGNFGSYLPNSTANFVGGGALFLNTSASITNCRFQYCRSGNGGAAYIYKSRSDIRDSQFQYNAAQNGVGGILYFRSSGTVSNCLLDQNTAGEGSGAAFGAAGPRATGEGIALTGCTITQNKSFIDGSAVDWNWSSGTTTGTLTISGCLISGNRSGDPVAVGAGGLRSAGPAANCVLADTQVCNNTFSNVQGIVTATGTTEICDCVGDINLDGIRNGSDLGILLGYWGACGPNGGCSFADLDGSGAIDGGDVGFLLAAWGACN
jgi:hypothetical protein